MSQKIHFWKAQLSPTRSFPMRSYYDIKSFSKLKNGMYAWTDDNIIHTQTAYYKKGICCLVANLLSCNNTRYIIIVNIWPSNHQNTYFSHTVYIRNKKNLLLSSSDFSLVSLLLWTALQRKLYCQSCRDFDHLKHILLLCWVWYARTRYRELHGTNIPPHHHTTPLVCFHPSPMTILTVSRCSWKLVENNSFGRQSRDIIQMRLKAFTWFYVKFTQETTYQVSSESPQFCTRC